MFENTNPKFTGLFQGQADFNTGRVAGYYYNSCPKVAFENSLANQNLENGSSLSNHRIEDYDHLPSPTPNILPIGTTKMPKFLE